MGDLRVLNPLPARTDCFLQFHLGQPYAVVSRATGKIHPAPSRVIVGPHVSRREDILWTGHLRVFTIRFSATGFRSIFGVPARVIRNTATDAEFVVGPAVVDLHSSLYEAEDSEIPVFAETFLLRKIAGQRSTDNAAAVLRLTRTIQQSATPARLHQVAARHHFGLRTVERLFQEFVGVSPKVFERLTRSKAALSLHRARPDRNWSEIASAAGYFDQAHLIRDFKGMNGSTPQAFARTSRLADELRSKLCVRVGT